MALHETVVMIDMDENRLRSRVSALRRDLIVLFSVVVGTTAAYMIWVWDSGVPEDNMGTVAIEPSAGAAGSSSPGMPEDFATLVGMGNSLMDRAQYGAAAECYRRALSLEEAPDVRVDYGACLHAMGLSQKALDEFRRVLRYDSAHAVACFNLGIAHSTLGHSDSARMYFRQYLELDPESPTAARARKALKELGE